MLHQAGSAYGLNDREENLRVEITFFYAPIGVLGVGNILSPDICTHNPTAQPHKAPHDPHTVKGGRADSWVLGGYIKLSSKRKNQPDLHLNIINIHTIASKHHVKSAGIIEHAPTPVQPAVGHAGEIFQDVGRCR